MQTSRPALLWFFTACLVALIDSLAGRFTAAIWKPLCAGALKRGGLTRMLRELMEGEARLLKAVRNGALRELGLPADRRPWTAFRQSVPANARAFGHRLVAYRNMLRDPEACVQRLLAKVRRDMALGALGRLRGAPCARLSVCVAAPFAAPAAARPPERPP